MPNTALGTLYRLGIAKNAAEGTAAGTATYDIQLYSGDVHPSEVRNRHEATDTLGYRRGGYKSRAHVEGSPVFPSFPDAVGLLLTGHFGADTIAGTVDPYSHVITRSNPLWHTVWMARPKNDATVSWERHDDVLIKAVELRGTAGNPIQVACELLGKSSEATVSAPTITTTNRLDNTGPYHTMIGATLDLDLDATPGTTQVRNISSFTLRFAYDNMDLIQTDELTPRFQDRGLWMVGFSADIVLADYTEYLNTFFGSKTASAQANSQSIVRGAIDFTLPVGPSADADRTLQAVCPALEFSLTPPEPDVSGAAVTATLTAELQHPASGEPATVTLKNAVSTSYAA